MRTLHPKAHHWTWSLAAVFTIRLLASEFGIAPKTISRALKGEPVRPSPRFAVMLQRFGYDGPVWS